MKKILYISLILIACFRAQIIYSQSIENNSDIYSQKSDLSNGVTQYPNNERSSEEKLTLARQTTYYPVTPGDTYSINYFN